MARQTANVHIEGLGELRRDLRTLGRGLPRELGASMRSAAATTVVPAARILAPHRSGRLAATLKAGSAGNRVVIRSRQPYANVIHWGGTTGPGLELGPGRGRIRIVANEFVLLAYDREDVPFMEAIADNLDAFFRRHGWA